MSIKMRVTVKDDGAKAILTALRSTAPAHLNAALYRFACRVMTASLRLVPVDTGSLRRSHFVSAPTEQSTTTTILSAGYVAPYAGYVHEDMQAEHINGMAKFLEGPYLELMPTAASTIAADMAKSKWGLMPDVPILFPTQGVFAETGAKSRHHGPGAAGRDAKARSKAAERMAQRASRSRR